MARIIYRVELRLSGSVWSFR